MYTVLIIENDERSAVQLESMLDVSAFASELVVGHVVVGQDAGASAGLARACDIAIVDIELGLDFDGIDLAKRCFPAGSSTQVIFVTGYIEYCQDVYATEHVCFLLKPVNQDRLEEALGRALSRLDMRRSRLLAVKTGTSTRMVPIDDIVFIESKNRRLVIHLMDEEVITYTTFSDLEARLTSSFVRCHKSFLVNMRHISELRSDVLLMDTGESVPISRRCRVSTQELLARFLTGRPV